MTGMHIGYVLATIFSYPNWCSFWHWLSLFFPRAYFYVVPNLDSPWKPWSLSHLGCVEHILWMYQQLMSEAGHSKVCTSTGHRTALHWVNRTRDQCFVCLVAVHYFPLISCIPGGFNLVVLTGVIPGGSNLVVLTACVELWSISFVLLFYIFCYLPAATLLGCCCAANCYCAALSVVT